MEARVRIDIGALSEARTNLEQQLAGPGDASRGRREVGTVKRIVVGHVQHPTRRPGQSRSDLLEFLCAKRSVWSAGATGVPSDRYGIPALCASASHCHHPSRGCIKTPDGGVH